jgi:hypothetical protein
LKNRLNLFLHDFITIWEYGKISVHLLLTHKIHRERRKYRMMPDKSETANKSKAVGNQQVTFQEISLSVVCMLPL